jgi:hypothetical protein
MNTYTVLMTACIDPAAGWIKLHRNDPETRLGDYCKGLRFWLELDEPRIDRLVFVENSGYPLDALRNLAATTNPWQRQVEFLSLNDNRYPRDAHYGYAELSMIDEALVASTALRTATHFIKATGRLTFPTVGRLLKRLPPDCMFAVDCRNSTLLTRLPQLFVSTQLMVFSTAFYKKHLHGSKAELKQPLSHIEKLFYWKLLGFKGQPGAMLRWPVNVAPEGVAAHWDKDYSSPKHKIINAARQLSRVLFPNWWI